MSSPGLVLLSAEQSGKTSATRFPSFCRHTSIIQLVTVKVLKKKTVRMKMSRVVQEDSSYMQLCAMVYALCRVKTWKNKT